MDRWKVLVLMFLFTLIFSAPFIYAGDEPGADFKNPEEFGGLKVPLGNSEAGRAAFVKLKCTTCHQVHGDSKLPTPVSANPGPTLAMLEARYTVGELADSIVSPSHQVAPRFQETESSLSPMGDFSETMTLRQLIDIVAYLKAQEAT